MLAWMLLGGVIVPVTAFCWFCQWLANRMLPKPPPWAKHHNNKRLCRNFEDCEDDCKSVVH